MIHPFTTIENELKKLDFTFEPINLWLFFRTEELKAHAEYKEQYHLFTINHLDALLKGGNTSILNNDVFLKYDLDSDYHTYLGHIKLPSGEFRLSHININDFLVIHNNRIDSMTFKAWHKKTVLDKIIYKL